ncbi:MAG: hypothetical protein ACYDAY_11920 [Candidatus Dormibacteria bacterium]
MDPDLSLLYEAFARLVKLAPPEDSVDGEEDDDGIPSGILNSDIARALVGMRRKGKLPSPKGRGKVQRRRYEAALRTVQRHRKAEGEVRRNRKTLEAIREAIRRRGLGDRGDELAAAGVDMAMTAAIRVSRNFSTHRMPALGYTFLPGESLGLVVSAWRRGSKSGVAGELLLAFFANYWEGWIPDADEVKSWRRSRRGAPPVPVAELGEISDVEMVDK